MPAGNIVLAIAGADSCKLNICNSNRNLCKCQLAFDKCPATANT